MLIFCLNAELPNVLTSTLWIITYSQVTIYIRRNNNQSSRLIFVYSSTWIQYKIKWLVKGNDILYIWTSICARYFEIHLLLSYVNRIYHESSRGPGIHSNIHHLYIVVLDLQNSILKITINLD
jgi:hypothetical protein